MAAHFAAATRKAALHPFQSCAEAGNRATGKMPIRLVRIGLKSAAGGHCSWLPAVPWLAAGFPFADFLEAPALLGGCGAVPPGSAAFEASGDPGAVLLRVVVVVLELGGDAGDVQAQAADS